jgi:hypothetical protein
MSSWTESTAQRSISSWVHKTRAVHSTIQIKSSERVYRLLISAVGVSFDDPASSSPLAGDGGIEHRGGGGMTTGGEGSELGLWCAQLQFDSSYMV